jgi:hypothetical protein
MLTALGAAAYVSPTVVEGPAAALQSLKPDLSE